MPDVSTAYRVATALRQNLERVILGKSAELLIPITAVLGGGHILSSDVPGVGKTVLCKAVARSLGCTFSRLQCTADLLPSDIIGVTIYNQKSSDFEFKRGPVFSQVFLADEINRATPKAQSALLECMGEHQITVSGHSYALASPFLVLATQNPIEFAGTFPLPEAQLDRFMLSLELGYPDATAERTMLENQQLQDPLDSLDQVTSSAEIQQAQLEVRQVKVSEAIGSYIVALVNYTRESTQLALGSSPRGSQALYRASQAWAAMQNRSYVIPDDVKDIAVAALSHRLIPQRRHDRSLAKLVVNEALNSVAVPVS